MIIRGEKSQEFPLLHAFIQEAFATAKVSNGDEQHFVERLRAGSNYLPELALVAEEEGTIIGHGMLSRAFVIDGTRPYETLLLAPLAVALDNRNQGVGSALVREGFRLAGEMGYTSVFLVGNPAYYGRFGFRAASSFGIAHAPDTIPARYVLACELVSEALRGIHGTFQIL